MEDKIERSILLKAPVDRVWRALSDHREFGEWFKADISEPFSVGAVIKCRSKYPGHEHLTWEMTTTEMIPERRLSFTWPAYYGEDSDRDASLDPYLSVTFELAAEKDGTRLTLVESGFSALPADYAPTAFRMNEQGWDEQMENIASHVSR